jgi:ABC-type dipeptide/oligopeptide/nickel transport system permease component
MAIARLIRTLAIAVAVVIVVGIILRVVSANPHNMIVSDIHDAGNWLVGPFHNVFSVKDAKLELGLNWGLAALVYLAVGSLLAGLLARGSMGSRFSRARPVA